MRQTVTEAKFDVNEFAQQEKALLRLLYDNARSPTYYYFFFTSGVVSNYH